MDLTGGGRIARRFATFILLGPFLVWLTFIILQLPHMIRVPDTAPLPFFGMALVFAAVVGYPAAALAYWIGLISSFADDVFTAGLFGMIPAAVCSWLAGR